MARAHDLVTLDRVKADLDVTSTDTADDAVLRRLVTTASRMATAYCGRTFLPRVETRLYDARGPHLGADAVHSAPALWGESARTLRLDDDLLSLTTLTNGDGTVVATQQYTFQPRSGYPKWRIDLLPSSGLGWTYDDDWQGAIAVAGVWGFHDDYANAWFDTLDTVEDDPLTAAATTITVNAADGVDETGSTRFQVGHLLRIETELLQVTAVTPGAAPVVDTITVQRGVNGSTAAQHAQNTAIQRFAVIEDIQQAVTGLAVWLYRNRGTVGERIQVLGGGEIRTLQAPDYIVAVLDGYVRGSWS